jgi:hypothetical protein
LNDTLKRELEDIDCFIKLLDKSLVNFLRNSHMMSKSPSRWNFRTFALTINHRLENSLRQLFIFQIEVYLNTDLFLYTLYSKARVLVPHPVCDLSALIGGEFNGKTVSRCAVLCIDDVVVTVATVHYSTAMSLVRVLQVVVVVIECIGRAVLQEETSLSLSKT